MKLGKIIGRVVCSQKIEEFDGAKFLLVQPLDENLNNAGEPIVATDKIQAGLNEIVYYETSKEAGRIYETVMNPSDASVMGIVDDINVIGKIKWLSQKL